MKNLKQIALAALTALPLSAGLAFAQTAPAQQDAPQRGQANCQLPKVAPNSVQAGKDNRNAPRPCTPENGANRPSDQRGGDLRGTAPQGASHRRGGGPVVGAAIAKSLGLSDQALREQLRGGKTIADLAKARGVSTASIHATALEALRTQLAADVKAGKIAQARATKMLTRAQADPNFGLNMGRHGGHGNFGKERGMGGANQPAQPAPTTGSKG